MQDLGEQCSGDGDFCELECDVAAVAAVEFQLQAAVKIDPQRVLSGVTRWMTRVSPVVMIVLH